MRSLLWLSLLSLPLAACGGPTTASPAPTSTPTPAGDRSDLLTRSPGSQRAVVQDDGTSYLFLELVDGYSTAEDTGAPACWIESWSEDGCPPTALAAAGTAARFADRPARLTLIGADGLCTATVGDVVLVNTSGCDPTWMIAAPLTGCPASVAPVGRVDDSFDPELRWLPRPDITPIPLVGGPAPRDPVHRDLVATWLAEPELDDGPMHEGKTAAISVDAGSEAFETFAASFAVGHGADECDWAYGERTAVGLRRGDTFTPIDVRAEWLGVIAWRGQVVGVAVDDLRTVDLQAIGPTGVVTPAFEQHVWEDHEECTQGGWFDIASACGP